MKVGLKRPQDFEAIQAAWKEINAPAYIRRTSDPKVFTIVPRKGVDSALVQLFIIDQIFGEEDRERMERKLYKTYFNHKIKEFDEQRTKWRNELKKLEQ